MPLIYGSFRLNSQIPYSVPLITEPHHLVTSHYRNSSIHFQYWHQAHSTFNSGLLVNDTQSPFTIIADARLYNRKNLIEKWGLVHSDAELILRAYQEWGEDCVKHLIGDFAFAIFDKNNHKLFLARDALGQRTLFYFIDQKKEFLFANLIRPLVSLKNNNELNPLKIAYFLTLIRAQDSSTSYRHIHQLEPGHYLTVCLDQALQKTRYWSARPLAKDPLILPTRNAYHQQFTELLQTVLAEYTSPKPLATELSGGLDSSTITSVAASLQPQALLPAFCHIPSRGLWTSPKKNWNYDDRHYMKSVHALYPNIEIHFIQDTHQYLFQYCDQLHYWLEQPPLNPANMLWMLAMVEKAVDLKLHTILCGTAGNLTFSWGGASNRKISTIRKFIQHIRQQVYDPWASYSAIHPTFASNIRLKEHYRLFNQEKDFNEIRLKFFDTGLRNFSASLYTTLRFLYGVDIIDPAADRRIVEFCLRLPPTLYRNDQGSRLLIRESMQGILPEIVRTRKTRGMQSADWYRKIEAQKVTLISLLQNWKNTNINYYIDIKFLLKKMQIWDFNNVKHSRNNEYIKYERLYLLKLLRAIEMGLFIQNSARY